MRAGRENVPEREKLWGNRGACGRDGQRVQLEGRRCAAASTTQPKAPLHRGPGVGSAIGGV
jgi:hypothetical protein